MGKKLIISFTDQSESFTNGAEYGRILCKIEMGLSVVDNNGMPIHIENKEVIKRTCKEYGYTPIFGKEHFGEWVEFQAIKNVNLN